MVVNSDCMLSFSHFVLCVTSRFLISCIWDQENSFIFPSMLINYSSIKVLCCEEFHALDITNTEWLNDDARA